MMLYSMFLFLYLSSLIFFFFFFNDTATTEIYTLSLHDALPISCRDEGVRFFLFLQPESDRNGRPRLALHGGERLFAHAHDFRRLDDLEPAAIDISLSLERRLDVGGPPHQLDPEARRELAQRQHRSFNFYARRVVATHRIQRDPNHRQASSTGTCCSSRE